MVLSFSLPIVAVEEVLKLIGRFVESRKQSQLKEIKRAKLQSPKAHARGMPPPKF